MSLNLVEVNSSLSPQAAAIELLRREEASRSLAAYIEYLDLGFVPALHHRKLIEHLEALERGDITNLMVWMPPGSAKALALNTPIPTPDGWKSMAELRIGDQVFAEDGRPCNVTWVSPIWLNRHVYAVTTDCGDEIIADHDHEWLVRACGKRECYRIKETHELCRKRSKRVMVRRASALILPERQLPIDPYVLGVWLGDGHSDSGRITSGDDDRAWMRGELERLGYVTTTHSSRYSFGIGGIRGHLNSFGILNDPFHGAHGLKRIPPIYLRASQSQRLSLLQGLVDTDGTVCPNRGCSTFCNTNRLLAEDVRELVRSLGIKAGWSESRAVVNGKDCGPAYRISFYLEGSARLPRKAIHTRNQERTPNTYIEVTDAGYASTVCIEVDSPSHLFLCGRSCTPTHNSTYASVLFPPWFMGRNPEEPIIGVSNATELAELFSRRARNIVASDRHRNVFDWGLSTDTQSVGYWENERGGCFMAAGTGTSIPGRRAALGLIDDPVKGRQDADSPHIQQKQWDWYVNDFYPRLLPHAKQLIIQTRWAEGDLSGRILDREAKKWAVLSLPMLAIDNDPLGRQQGERLWPEWFTDDMVKTAQQDVRAWNALYQQDPAPEDGEYFKRDYFQEYEVIPAGMHLYGASDYAVSEGEGDYTEHGVFGLDFTGNIYLIDWWRGQTSSDVWIEKQCDLIATHSPLIWFGESGPIRKAIEPFLKRRMTERQTYCRLEWLSSIHDKVVRCRPFQARAAMGNVFVPNHAPWKPDLMSQLMRFPAGKYDDGVDVCSLIGRGLEHARPPEAKKERPKQQRQGSFRADGNAWMGSVTNRICDDAPSRD